jgi:enterochelin esterase-like enzyme
MKTMTALLLMACVAGAQVTPATYPYRTAAPTASPRMAKLRKEIELGNRSAVQQFWDETAGSGTPLVEPIPGDDRNSLVTFLWRGDSGTHNVAVVGGINGAEPAKNQMLQLGDSGVWYISYEVRNDARFAYALSPNDSLKPLLDPARDSMAFKPDPLNPRHLPDLYASWVELPNAPAESWTTAAPGAGAGELKQTKFTSSLLGDERDVWVYTPPGFNPNGERYPLLVLFDGRGYVSETAPARRILDHLIAGGGIPPVVAILVGNIDRARDLMCSADFSDSLARELVPWAREKYHATMDAAQTVVAGSSLGGLAAGFAGLTHPEAFGNVLSLSGSYWWSPRDDPEPEWLIRQFARSPKKPLRMFIAVGSMEEPASQLVTNRHLRDVLTARGYQVEYQEFNGVHGYLNWRSSLSDGLLALMGKDQHWRRQ